MIRLVLYLLLAILLLTLLRYVVGMFARSLGLLLFRDGTGGSSAATSGSSTARLHRDPVCGTYVAETASIKKLVDGRLIHFCSEACRDKYRPPA